MSEWMSMRLGDAATVFDGPHATPTKTEDGPWYLSISSLSSGRLNLDESAHLSEYDYPKWTKRTSPQRGDTLFSYETRLGEAAFWDRDERAALGRRMGLLRPNRAIADPRFLSYLYIAPDFQETIRHRTVRGATVDRILIAEMPDWQIALPPLEEQRRIAGVLSTLDDLIDTNRKLCEVLIAQARAMYDRLQSSSSADICTFASTVDVVSGGTPKTSVSEYWDGPIPWYSVADCPEDVGPWVLRTARTVTDEGIENSAASVLPVGTTIISARGTVGKLALVGEPMAMNQSCYGLQSRFDSRGAFTYFSAQDIVGDLQRSSHGSVFDTITRATLDQVVIRVPSTEAITEFETQVEPLMELARGLQKENTDLTSTRDELLPLLMSGQIRVRQVNP
ncbi:MAG: restriction endonuclease subunit S [Cellulomonadaceae bacterium]|nr:restriction endonuclease subunit S [Cellulomonadaceae bacterium]